MNRSIKYFLGIYPFILYQEPASIEWSIQSVNQLLTGRVFSIFLMVFLLGITFFWLVRYLRIGRAVPENDLEDRGERQARDARKTAIESPGSHVVNGASVSLSRGHVSRPPGEFLTRLNEILEDNMSDPEFGIKQLCQSLQVSRSQLHQKVKSLTGKSTSIHIRSIRLQKAKYLLSNHDWNISEIAYEVGFKNPAYFTQVFTKEFGMSPSSFRDQ